VCNFTKKDPVLASILNSALTGDWYDTLDLLPYYSRRNEISVHQVCLVWGLRVVVTKVLSERILKELHEGHRGVVKMKALARSYIWWPNIDKELEQLAGSCYKCLQKRPNPEPILHSWDWPSKPWKRIHINFAGPFFDRMFFIVIDAHSKWPEVVQMTKTTSTATINALNTIFSRCGYPEQLVSDNGPQLPSSEFESFLKLHEIKHITTAPWHPSSNRGLAERFVQTLKKVF